MALRDKLTVSAAPYLRPGERIQAVVSAQTRGILLMLLGGVVFLIANRYRIVVATDQRLLVLAAGRLRATRAHGVVVELPRQVQLGPPNAALWHRCPLGAETLRIHRRFFRDMAQADALSASAPPPPWGFPPQQGYPPPPPASAPRW